MVWTTDEEEKKTIEMKKTFHIFFVVVTTTTSVCVSEMWSKAGLSVFSFLMGVINASICRRKAFEIEKQTSAVKHTFSVQSEFVLCIQKKKKHTHALIVFMGLEFYLSIWIRSSFAHIQFTHAIHTFYDSILCRKLKSLCDSVFFCCCCCSCRLWFKSYLFVDSVACAYLSALERFFSRNKIHFCRMYLWCCSIFLWAFFVRLEIGIIAE